MFNSAALFVSGSTWDMTSRDQLSPMEMGCVGFVGILLSFSAGRSKVGPNTVARLCRDILFTLSFSAILAHGEGEVFFLLFFFLFQGLFCSTRQFFISLFFSLFIRYLTYLFCKKKILRHKIIQEKYTRFKNMLAHCFSF